MGSLGRLGNAWKRTREIRECSGILEFSLGILNCGCGEGNNGGFNVVLFASLRLSGASGGSEGTREGFGAGVCRRVSGWQV